MTLSIEEARSRTKAIMPDIVDELKDLVTHASCSFPGFPAKPVHEMRAAVIDLLKRSGVPSENLQELDLGAGYPAVYGTMDGPPGSPTVLLYAHYDVQPAPTDGWETDPWTATLKDDGRLYGRGVADDKSGIVIHAGALQVLQGKAPVNLIIVIEGEEETESHLEAYVEAHPELFRADIYLVADMGPMVVGQPVLTTGLRGDSACIVTVSTLAHPVHSGLFGGGAPDALMALAKMLSSLLDENGSIIVPGLEHYTWEGSPFDEDLFRKASGLLDGTKLLGEGGSESLATRVWSSPSISAIGIDAPTVDKASNIVIPEARARISMRVAPGADGEVELQKLFDYLRKQVPWGAHVELKRTKVGQPFLADPKGEAVTTAEDAMADAYGTEAGSIGTGGSIPLISSFAKIAPDAEMIIYGAQDFEKANIHAVNESVDPNEIEHNIIAEALMLTRFA